MVAGTGASDTSICKTYDYISWIIGDKTLAVFGDIDSCGNYNLNFLTDPGGLYKTVSENYLAIYAYFIAIHQKVIDAEHCGKNKEEQELIFNSIRNLPLKVLSTESNINKLFEEYLGTNEWNLYSRIQKLSANDLRKDIDYLKTQIDYLVQFVKDDLKTYLMDEKKKLKTYPTNSYKDDDIAVGKFVQETSTYIGNRMSVGSQLAVREREYLRGLFGNEWNHLMPNSQTSLISAGILWKSSADIQIEAFDFSGICICATSALEAELRRIFFDGLIEFMVLNYGEPDSKNLDSTYKNWPEELLTIPRYELQKNPKSILDKKKIFTMGMVPHLFGLNKNFQIIKGFAKVKNIK
ncbi:hypothetical protein P261_00130 [Lachnospiraceae bacterium TWA4]|nr:hypothetical protein P261_00130 [Lachnospiraceae bacterium TWA4]